MNRIIILITNGLLFLGLGCGSTPQATITAPQPTPSHDAESVNSVEGSFTVTGYFAKVKPPEAVTLTQAYARRVKNEEDPGKQDILILLTEKAVPRKVGRFYAGGGWIIGSIVFLSGKFQLPLRKTLACLRECSSP